MQKALFITPHGRYNSCRECGPQLLWTFNPPSHELRVVQEARNLNQLWSLGLGLHGRSAGSLWSGKVVLRRGLSWVQLPSLPPGFPSHPSSVLKQALATLLRYSTDTIARSWAIVSVGLWISKIVHQLKFLPPTVACLRSVVIVMKSWLTLKTFNMQCLLWVSQQAMYVLPPRARTLGSRTRQQHWEGQLCKNHLHNFLTY